MAGEAGRAGTSLLAAARALAPRIAAAGDQIEADRRLPRSLVAALTDAGLFRMLLPQWVGGGETDLPTFLCIVEEVAKADGSTAWCLAQNSARAALVVPCLDPGTARRIFGQPQAVVANGAGSPGRAIKGKEGYDLSGAWSFASGCSHATWLAGLATVYTDDGHPVRRDDGVLDQRTLLFPTSAAQIVDTWQVSGLRGTGSYTITVTGCFVPDERAFSADGRKLDVGPLGAVPDRHLFAAGFSAVAMGIARGALDAFVALAAAKTPRGARGVLREDAVVQTQVAHAEAQLRSVRAFLHEMAEEVWETRSRGDALAEGQLMLLRLAATSGIHQAAQVVDTVYHAAGATAIFTSNGFERRFRDVHAVTQQAQASQLHFQTVGRFLLGLDPYT